MADKPSEMMTNLFIELNAKTIYSSYKPETLKTNGIIELKNDLKKEKELSSRSFELLKLVIQCEKQMENITNLADLLDLRSQFGTLNAYYSKEYENYRLCDNAVSVLYSYLQQYFASHPNVLIDHNQALMNLFSQWRDILKYCSISLTTDDCSSGKLDMDCYDYLMWTTFIPAVQKTINEWNLDQSDSLIDFIHKWKTYVGEHLVDYMLDQLILPKIIAQMDLLDTKSDSKAVYVLLDLWKPLMENRLKSLYQLIEEKKKIVDGYEY